MKGRVRTTGRDDAPAFFPATICDPDAFIKNLNSVVNRKRTTQILGAELRFLQRKHSLEKGSLIRKTLDGLDNGAIATSYNHGNPVLVRSFRCAGQVDGRDLLPGDRSPAKKEIDNINKEIIFDPINQTLARRIATPASVLGKDCYAILQSELNIFKTEIKKWENLPSGIYNPEAPTEGLEGNLFRKLSQRPGFGDIASFASNSALREHPYTDQEGQLSHAQKCNLIKLLSSKYRRLRIRQILDAEGSENFDNIDLDKDKCAEYIQKPELLDDGDFYDSIKEIYEAIKKAQDLDRYKKLPENEYFTLLRLEDLKALISSTDKVLALATLLELNIERDVWRERLEDEGPFGPVMISHFERQLSWPDAPDDSPLDQEQVNIAIKKVSPKEAQLYLEFVTQQLTSGLSLCKYIREPGGRSRLEPIEKNSFSIQDIIDATQLYLKSRYVSSE